jgi:hypothetical protein
MASGIAISSPLVFDPVAHRYELDGIPVPSVTSVLKHCGYIRLDGVPADVLERARDRGQRVHSALHFLFEDDLDESTVDEEIAGYLESARLYLQSHVTVSIRAEMRVWSKRYHCAGTLDLLAVHRDGQVFVGDFKTGEPADVAADMQLAAYQAFLLEMAVSDESLHRELRSAGSPILRRRSIRLFNDGRIARESLYGDSKDFTRFLSALSVVHDQGCRPAPSVAWDDER